MAELIYPDSMDFTLPISFAFASVLRLCAFAVIPIPLPKNIPIQKLIPEFSFRVVFLQQLLKIR